MACDDASGLCPSSIVLGPHPFSTLEQDPDMDQARIRDRLDKKPKEAKGGVKNCHLAPTARRYLVHRAPRCMAQVLVSGGLAMYLTKSEAGFKFGKFRNMMGKVHVLHVTHHVAEGKGPLDIVSTEKHGNK